MRAACIVLTPLVSVVGTNRLPGQWCTFNRYYGTRNVIRTPAVYECALKIVIEQRTVAQGSEINYRWREAASGDYLGYHKHHGRLGLKQPSAVPVLII